jgi:hypothetical protein
MDLSLTIALFSPIVTIVGIAVTAGKLNEKVLNIEKLQNEYKQACDKEAVTLTASLEKEIAKLDSRIGLNEAAIRGLGDKIDLKLENIQNSLNETKISLTRLFTLIEKK